MPNKKIDDEKAFTSLFYSYKDKLYSYLLTLTQSEEEAEDVVQEVFLRLWNNRSSLANIDNINAYLFRAVKNHVIDESRRFANNLLKSSRELNEADNITTNTPIEELVSKEIKDKLHEAIAKLPKRQREIFLMHNEQGMPYAKIAEQLGISPFTVQNHIKKALKILRSYLSDNYPGLYLIIIAYLI